MLMQYKDNDMKRNPDKWYQLLSNGESFKVNIGQNKYVRYNVKNCLVLIPSLC